MSVNRTPPSNGGKNSLGTPTVKRSARELMGESPPIDELNVIKKPNVAENSKDLTIIMSNDNSGNQIEYNVPIDNKFSDLNKTVNSENSSANIADANKKKSKKNIPPITVVGAVNFTRAISIVSEIAKDNYYLKYMSIGVKIHISDLNHYNAIKSKLISDNIEFYSHDLNPGRYEQYILSGINKMNIADLTNEIKSKGFDVMAINEIPINKPRFLNEGLYRVTFKGSVDLTKLSRLRLNHTVVKWKANIRRNKVTQCRRCLIFGHGSRNCNVAQKCSKCGSGHPSSSCTVTSLKCANCDGEHDANAPECPKRKSFLEMRQKMSAKFNIRKPSNNQELPRTNSRLEFPELPTKNSWSFGQNPLFKKSSTSKTDFTLKATASNSDTNATITTTDKRHPWAWVHDNPNVHPSWPLKCGNLFSAMECSNIFKELTIELSQCMNKADQIQVMFKIATKYIYNDNP